jgi:hypothetical protein
MMKMDISSWNTYHSVTKVCCVTRKSSLINTFLVVHVPCYIYHVHDLLISPSVGGVELVEYVCAHPCLTNYFSEEDPYFVLEDVE